MNARVIGKQRGQAMSEFVVAMIAFVPLVLGVIYIGKYSDIKHQAIQASRYAAFERALDPHSHEGGTTVQDETVARFFRDGGQHTIGFQDKATGSTRTDENPVWAQVNGNPMIGQYPDVSVQFSCKSVKDSTTSTLLFPMDLMTKSFSGLNDDAFPSTYHSLSVQWICRERESPVILIVIAESFPWPAPGSVDSILS